jgi:predicted nucleic acid-binding protein
VSYLPASALNPTPQDDAPNNRVPFVAVLEVLAQQIQTHHQRNLSKPITGPNEWGVFPDSGLRQVPPIVADANNLRRDLVRSTRTGIRTILVNGANAGMFRIFCAEHVLDEVEEQLQECADAAGVERHAVLNNWEENYLPLLRLVDVQHQWLDPSESERVDDLRSGDLRWRDADDVPTAILALQLGAYVLSTDKKLVWCVYGHDYDTSEHVKWVDTLREGGDAATLEELNRSTEIVVGGAGLVVYESLKWLWQNVSPVAALLVLAGAGYALYRASPDTRQKLLNAATPIGEWVLSVSTMYQGTSTSFLGAAPDVPSWEALAQTVNKTDVLGRACMQTLARSPVSQRSAAELSSRLQFLEVPHGEAKVREMLRSSGTFVKVYTGRWQLGRPSNLYEEAVQIGV